MELTEAQTVELTEAQTVEPAGADGGADGGRRRGRAPTEEPTVAPTVEPMAAQMVAPLAEESVLARLIAVDRDEFAGQYWGQQPLLSPAAELPWRVYSAARCKRDR